jgi:hypothetical protein
LCLSSPKDGWKRGVSAIGWELPYLCSCDSGSNHAVRFLQSWKTALIARDALARELWWLARRDEILCCKIQVMLVQDGWAGALAVFVNVSSHDRAPRHSVKTGASQEHEAERQARLRKLLADPYHSVHLLV